MLTINTSAISSESFDNEIVAIHFLKGTYFSLRGASMAMWSWLQQGADETTLAKLLATRYQLDPKQSMEAVSKAIDLLRAAELVIESDQALPDFGAYDLSAGPDDYQEAVIESFEDLQELIAIDPVHEVDPMQGWPHRPPTMTLD